HPPAVLIASDGPPASGPSEPHPAMPNNRESIIPARPVPAARHSNEFHRSMWLLAWCGAERATRCDLERAIKSTATPSATAIDAIRADVSSRRLVRASEGAHGQRASGLSQ